MKIPILKWQTVVIILIAIAGVGSGLAFNDVMRVKTETEELVGKEFFVNTPLPQMKLIDRKTKVDLSSEIGRGNSLLIYLVTSCRGCEMEADMLAEIDEARIQNMPIYGISEDSDESLDKFISEHKFNFPIVRDQGGEFRKRLDIKFFPENIVIKDGIIVKYWFGNPENKEAFYRKLNL